MRLRAPGFSLLQWSVFVDVVTTFVVAFVLVSGVILAGATVVFLQRYPELEVADLLMAMPLFGAHMSVYTIPLTLLFAVIWTFSRLQQDSELTALRACGVHLHTIVLPALFVGVLVSAGMLGLYDRVVPLAHYQWKVLVKRTLVNRVNRIRAGDQTHFRFQRYEIFVGGIEPSADDGVLELRNVLIYRLRPDADLRPEHRFVASRARMLYDEASGIFVLRLYDGHDLIFGGIGEPATQPPLGFDRAELRLQLGEGELELVDQIREAPEGLRSVRLSGGRLEAGRFRSGGQLEEVRVLLTPTADVMQCDEVLVTLTGSQLWVRLADLDSAQRAGPLGWQHVFEPTRELELPEDDVARLSAALEGGTPGELLEARGQRASLRGVHAGKNADGHWILRSAEVALAPPPLELTARTALVRAHAEAPEAILELTLTDGEWLNPSSRGTRAQRLGFASFDIRLALDNDRTRQVRISDLTFDDLYRNYLLPENARDSSKLDDDAELLTELHYRYAVAFAPFFFVLVGAPAALILRTRSRMASFGITLVKVFVLYFPSIILTKALCQSNAFAANPEWIPVILWSGNLLFAVLGGLYFFLLHRI